jgi:outer membrane protein
MSMSEAWVHVAGVTLLCSSLPLLGQQADLPTAPTALHSNLEGQQTTEPPALKSYLLPPNPAAGVLPSPQVEINHEHEYTLPELIDIAERAHPQTRIAWVTAKNAALASGIAASTYYPRISATIVGGYQGSSGSNSAFGVSTNESASATGSVSAMSAEWLLFDFGGRNHVVDATRKLAKVSSIAFTGEHQAVIYQVCIAYYSYNAARLRHGANEASLRNAREIEVAAENRYRDGIGTVLETNQARQATALAQLNLIQAQGAEENAYAALLATLGVSPLEQLRIASLAPRRISQDLLQPINQVVAESLARRSDVLAAYAAEQASQAAVKAAATQYLPKIFVAGTGAYVSGGLGLTAIPAIGEQLPTFNISGNHWNGAIIGGVTVPVFDGRRRAQGIEQAKNESVKAAATLDRVRIEAVREVVAAQNTLKTSIEAERASAVLVDASQTGYDAALEAYKHGVGTVTAVLTAQTALLQAQLSFDESESATQTAAVTLAFARGQLGGVPH